MAKITYKELSPEMNRMMAPRTIGAGRTSVGFEGNVGEFYFIEIDRLIPFRNQARQQFDGEALNQLAASIKEVGIRQPLSIMAIPERPGFYEVISGERRLRAAKIAGLLKIPCLMVKEHDKADEIALIENVHRSDLHPIELGRALKILMIQKNHGGQRELAQTLGLSESSVSELLSIARLPEEILDFMILNNIKARDIIRKVLKETSINHMYEILKSFVVKKDADDSGLGVDKTLLVDDKSDKEPKKAAASKSILRISIKDGAFNVQNNAIRNLDDEEKIELIEVLSSLLGELKK